MSAPQALFFNDGRGTGELEGCKLSCTVARSLEKQERNTFCLRAASNDIGTRCYEDLQALDMTIPMTHKIDLECKCLNFRNK
jgi:hypothetical protein